ncbi:MAG: transcription termination factor NusA [Clostridia bacterium]|jgi:N utilization substance protein A
MNVEFIHALEQIEKEKGISKKVLIEAMQEALLSAYRKNFGNDENISVNIDSQTGRIRVYATKTVVKEVKNSATEVALEQAIKSDPSIVEGDLVQVESTPERFGRIAAQTAKQVVMQRIREAEKNLIFEEFYSKENDIVTGIIQHADKKNVIVDLGRIEGIMPASEQVPNEKYLFNKRMKFYVLEVKNQSKGPSILLSRSHPSLIKRLFELEVPEIFNGVVEIKSIAREAGSRTKMAVWSHDSNVDPVGACVGQRGIRVQNVVEELNDEKIDILKWSPNPAEYISNSLSPAEVIRVEIFEDEKAARVTVPDHQLSLAIGKEGQNARLAARLTGWKIDIKSESQMRKLLEQELFAGNLFKDPAETNEEPEDSEEYEATEDTEDVDADFEEEQEE